MRKLRLAGVCVVAVVVFGGLAAADVPDSGVIHGCRDGNGGLRVIDTSAGQACKKNETPLSWGQIGPAGPPGPAGPSDVFVATHPAPATSWAISVSVPAGSYLVTGYATVVEPQGSLGQGGVCTLGSSQGPNPQGTTSVQGAGGNGAALPVQATFTFGAPDTVSMACTGDTTTAGPSNMAQGHLTVLAVGAIH